MSDQETREKIIHWLNEKWRGSKFCPICGSSNWAVGEILGEIREFKGGALVLPGQLFPLVVVTCQTCGNTVLLNAIVAGIVKAPPPQAPVAQTPGPSSEPSQEVKQ